MADQREAQPKQSNSHRHKRRRKFYESPDWNWPQFDPASCQQCGHVIPMHETGWILQEFILCQTCYDVLDDERNRRGSVTIAPGVVFHRDDAPDSKTQSDEPVQIIEASEEFKPVAAVDAVDAVASTEPPEAIEAVVPIVNPLQVIAVTSISSTILSFSSALSFFRSLNGNSRFSRTLIES
jgi:hypothetical protein